MLENLIGRGQNGRDKAGPGTVRRPVIGLALGGGAARGFAHIGIIRTLIAHGIVPNVVVGTSIGAVVGGAYAAGHLDTLEEWARSLQPRNILGYLDIRLNGSGLIGGAKLAAQLEGAIAFRLGQLRAHHAGVGQHHWHAGLLALAHQQVEGLGVAQLVARADRPVHLRAAIRLGAELVVQGADAAASAPCTCC